MWKTRIPMKLKVFLWLVLEERLQSASQLKKMGWKGNLNCVLCNKPEDTNHILFSCPMARFVWICIKEALGWERIPNSINEFFSNWLNKCRGVEKTCGLYCFTMVAWGLWKIRNDMAINLKFCRQLSNILYMVSLDMQKWKFLMKEQEREFVDKKLEKLKDWYFNFKKRLEARPYRVMISCSSWVLAESC